VRATKDFGCGLGFLTSLRVRAEKEDATKGFEKVGMIRRKSYDLVLCCPKKLDGHYVIEGEQ